MAREAIHRLLTNDVALDKLGSRGISTHDAEQLLRNRHETARNPRAGSDWHQRVLLIGHTNGGRVLTLVIESTVDPTTWMIVTGWNATDVERNLLSRAHARRSLDRP